MDLEAENSRLRRALADASTALFRASQALSAIYTSEPTADRAKFLNDVNRSWVEACKALSENK